MGNYTDKQWDRVRETYMRYWAGTLDRPVLPCVVRGERTGPSKARGSVFNFADPATGIIEAIDEDMSRCEFLGDSFPLVYTHMLGPGVLAAMIDGELIKVQPTKSTVWFSPKRVLPIEALHFEFNPANPWFNRLKDLYIAGTKKWRGRAIIAMTDLGGTMDILSTFRTPENLLTDLYDAPDQVARCAFEIQSVWLKCYHEFTEIISQNPLGYCSWSGIITEKPSYLLQSDFAYMIGPEAFREFVLPELISTARQLSRPFYHLDGPGQLPHLDMLLDVEEIAGIQWVPGAGNEEGDWLDVYRRIGARGRKLQVIDISDRIFHEIVKVVPSPGQIARFVINYSVNEKEKAIELLSTYDVPV